METNECIIMNRYDPDARTVQSKFSFASFGARADVPEGPGLGVELDEDKMKKYKSAETELGKPINIDYPKY